MTIDRMIFAGAAAASLLWTGAAVGQDVTPQAASCMPIRNVAQLQAINNNPAGSYCLANDIDAGSVANFIMINGFQGKFFGNGYAIRNLTIKSSNTHVGLFSGMSDAVIQDVSLVNVSITASSNGAVVGGLTGRVVDNTETTTISRVHVSGQVKCTGQCLVAGGIVGYLESWQAALMESSSSVTVIGPGAAATIAYVGGAVGYAQYGTIVRRTVATGHMTCAAAECAAGGLIGASLGLVDRCAAAGPVTVQAGGFAGGLTGVAVSTFAAISRSHASGAVDGSAAASAGGLVGGVDDATIEESYSVGPVTGSGNVGGLIGLTGGAPTITSAYWDTVTSKRMTSAAGTGYSTGQLRNELPPGFGKAWSITKKRSYPFLDDADIDFAAPLATLAKSKRVYTFLPIDQHDASQYAGVSNGANLASLATVYTTIARAIGITKNVNALKGVKIDTYFWDDATKATTWQGPVTTRATLGTFAAIAANVPLNNTNVVGAMKTGQLVLLRGTYTKANGNKAQHWLLGTLFTAVGKAVGTVIANDPWTGEQVMIDPATKKVLSPTNFPLTGFKVDGYQPVTLN
jgi:hypothetical protein